MPDPRPPIPQRRSSLEPKPQPQKKRISLSTMPILSKLGLVKSSSQPNSPTENTIPSAPPILPPRLSPLSPRSNPIFETAPPEETLKDEPEMIDASTDDLRETSTEIATHKGRNGSLHLNIPSVPPPAYKTPPRGPQSPIESIRSAKADLGILREVDENDDHKGRLSRFMSDQTATKPSSCPKSIWLCSKPPISPPTSPTDLSNARRRSGSRPLVVRAMSTGRLASEFDDEGRVVCLSNHCERVLKARTSMFPAPSPIRAGNHLSRSMSNQDQPQSRRQVIRARTSDLFPMMSPDKQMRKQASWKREDNSRTWKELSA